MNKIILISFLIIGLTVEVFSQNDETQTSDKIISSIGLNIGFNDIHVRDKYISPFIFNGTIFSSRIFYDLNTGNNFHSLKLLFSTGKINSDIQQRDVTSHIANISYSFTHLVNTWDVLEHPLSFSIGPGLSIFGSYTSFITSKQIANAISSDDTWYVNESLNLLVSGEYKFDERKSFSIQLTLPVISLIKRPENGHYLSNSNLEIINDSKFKLLTGGKLEFPWDEFVFLTELEYKTPISGNANLHCTYMFGYASSDSPAKLVSMGMYMNNFLLGVDWML